jgi:hypothetical protein
LIYVDRIVLCWTFPKSEKVKRVEVNNLVQRSITTTLVGRDLPGRSDGTHPKRPSYVPNGQSRQSIKVEAEGGREEVVAGRPSGSQHAKAEDERPSGRYRAKVGDDPSGDHHAEVGDNRPSGKRHAINVVADPLGQHTIAGATPSGTRAEAGAHPSGEHAKVGAHPSGEHAKVEAQPSGERAEVGVCPSGEHARVRVHPSGERAKDTTIGDESLGKSEMFSKRRAAGNQPNAVADLSHLREAEAIDLSLLSQLPEEAQSKLQQLFCHRCLNFQLPGQKGRRSLKCRRQRSGKPTTKTTRDGPRWMQMMPNS